jgi:3-hydroxymyristoyl/3-hydroxydecanoyl-(acyl carrier protein) dehydratase
VAEARFAAFSFVDRIVSRSDGGRIEGWYTVPAHVTRFPPSLMAEAVGQLAAWWAMDALEFVLRPVAGLAAETRYHAAVQPGQTLHLEADVVRCDADAVAYGGRALVGGRPAVELVDCVGPMLPLDGFDDPAALRADFDTLCGAGAPAARFGGVPPPRLQLVEAVPGRQRRARLHVPGRDAAAFFGDHFPRRPVYPGTLLMDAMAGVALDVAAEARPREASLLAVRRVTDVKIRAFTPPGAVLELAADLVGDDADGVHMKLAARADGKAVAAARVEIAAPGGAA